MKLTSTMIFECLKRYREWCSRQLGRTHWAIDPTMSEDFEAREKWLDERLAYLKREYEAAHKAERKLPPR